MKTKPFSLTVLFALAGGVLAAARAENVVPVAAQEPASVASAVAAPFDLAKAKADYPLDTCVVSGDKLGEMGEPVDFVFKQDGRSDRLVRFCCKACIKTFKKDPAQYLEKIEAATAAKTAAGSTR